VGSGSVDAASPHLGAFLTRRKARVLVGPCGAGRPLGGPTARVGVTDGCAGRPLGGPPARVNITDGWPTGRSPPSPPVCGATAPGLVPPTEGRWSEGLRAGVGTWVLTADLHDDRPALGVGELVTDCDG
jgi:hypothetical protein